ncbi:MAG: proprotein convertase P-domain-containing protein, partial [Bacteroidetes bacterium]|nr:proprotein convertase P-domain-containing protein [Bacteroidota bacterium]
MKKFTLLIVLLVFAVGFSQQETSLIDYTKNNPVNVKEQNVPIKATVQNKILSGPKTFISSRGNTSIEDLLIRLAEVGNSFGSISENFTQNEQQMLRNHFAGRNVSTKNINYTRILSGPVADFKTSDPNAIVPEGPRPQRTSSSNSFSDSENVPITLTYNTDNIITAGNSVACPGGDNFQARFFLLDIDFGITTEFTITDGEIGVQSVDATFDVTVNVIAADASFPTGYPGAGTLLGSEAVNIPGGSDLSIVNYTFTTPVVVPAGTQFLIVEVVQQLTGITFFIGGTAGETADSWLASVNCGLAEYLTTTAIGFPDAHYYITVTGDTAGGGGGGPVVAHGWESQGLGYGNLDPEDPSVYNTVSPGSGTADFESSGAIDPNDPTTGYVMDNFGEVWSLDVASGVYTSLGNNGVNDAVGLEFNPVDGVLYMATTGSLYTIDTGTGAATLVGALGTGGGLAIALAIDGSGNGWTYDIVDDSFYSVDLGSGAAALVGALGFDANFGQGMSWDPNTDQVYLAAFNFTLFDTEIRTVDLATGATTLVGVFLPGGLNQLAWMSIPDAGGGGGGASCTVGVYSDRATFVTETGGLLVLEDWDGGPGGIAACGDLISELGDLFCYLPGEIQPGIEITSNNIPGTQDSTLFVEAGFGGFGTLEHSVGTNFFTDFTIVTFPNMDVDSFGFDVIGLIGGSTIDIRIFGTGGLITTETVVAPPSGQFFGFVAGETVIRVELEDLTGVTVELIAQTLFGACIGGGGGTITECVSPALAIPDNDPLGVFSTLTVPSGGTITDLNIDLVVTHTWVGDLIVTLESPAGTVITLIDQMGVPASAFGCSENDLIITLDDEAATPIEDECSGSPITGSFIPEEALSAFDGEDASGPWILGISDNAAGDLGTLDMWCVVIEIIPGGGSDLCADAAPVACGDVVTGDTSNNTDTGGNAAPDEWFSYTGTPPCPAGVFTDRSLFDAATAGGTMFLEDFNGGPSTIQQCGLVISNAGEACFPPGEILVGIEISSNNSAGGQTVYIDPADGFGNTVPVVGSNTFTDYTIVNFPNNDVNAFGFDLITIFGVGPVDVRIFGVGGLIDTQIATATNPESFWGYIASEIIVGIEIEDLTGANVEVIGMLAFGDCGGGSGPEIVTLSLCDGGTTYDSYLRVFDDCTLANEIASNDDFCALQSELSFFSDGTSTYYIMVEGFGTNSGPYSLEVTCVQAFPPPNDLIVNAIDLDDVGCPFTDPNVVMPLATVEGGNPVDCNIDGANGVWYKTIPAANGTITATIESPAGLSHVTFYTAPDLDATVTELVLVPWFDNQCVPGTTTTIPVLGGQAYYIFVVNTGGITDITIDCDLLGIDDNVIEGFNYYPNPASDTIILSALDNIETVVIYNILGQKVIDLIVDATSIQVNVSSL